MLLFVGIKRKMKNYFKVIFDRTVSFRGVAEINIKEGGDCK